VEFYLILKIFAQYHEIRGGWMFEIKNILIFTKVVMSYVGEFCEDGKVCLEWVKQVKHMSHEWRLMVG
jgi:hypothetical protein